MSVAVAAEDEVSFLRWRAGERQVWCGQSNQSHGATGVAAAGDGGRSGDHTCQLTDAWQGCCLTCLLTKSSMYWRRTKGFSSLYSFGERERWGAVGWGRDRRKQNCNHLYERSQLSASLTHTHNDAIRFQHKRLIGSFPTTTTKKTPNKQEKQKKIGIDVCKPVYWDG